MSVSLSVSPSTLTKLKTLEASGQFGSVSDIVYISVCEFLGKIKVYEKDPGFDYSMLVILASEDNLPKGKISISLSTYIDNELKQLAEVVGKSKSYIIRMAIDDFVDSYHDDTRKTAEWLPIQKGSFDFHVCRNELKEIMRDILKELIDEK